MKQLTECIKGGYGDMRVGWLLKFNYDIDAVEYLKRMIPHTARNWNDETKTWWVSESYSDVIKDIFGNFEALAFLQGKLL